MACGAGGNSTLGSTVGVGVGGISTLGSAAGGNGGGSVALVRIFAISAYAFRIGSP